MHPVLSVIPTTFNISFTESAVASEPTRNTNLREVGTATNNYVTNERMSRTRNFGVTSDIFTASIVGDPSVGHTTDIGVSVETITASLSGLFAGAEVSSPHDKFVGYIVP